MARGSSAGLLDGGGSPGGLAGRRGCSFPSCCSKQGKLKEEARRGAASGDAAGRRGWTASRAAEGGGDEGKGRGGEDGAGPDRGGGRRGRGARHEGAAAAAVGGEVEEGHVAAGVEDAGRRRARRARRKTGRGGGVSLVRRDEEEKRRGIEGER